MTRFILNIILSLTAATILAATPSINYPQRCNNAVSLQEFVRLTSNLNEVQRDSVLFEQIKRGNMPDALRKSVLITEYLTDAEGTRHTVQLSVAPDVVTIGDNIDYLRIPMLPLTAQKIANLCGAILPTSKISDIIHRHSIAKLNPHPMTPDSTMTTLRIFILHNSIINNQMTEAGYRLGDFVAGHKKDIVITNRIDSLSKRVHIYGWHYPTGKNIQPLYSKHYNLYTDYSHGVRLIANVAIIDGKPYLIADILRHPVLYALLSYEPKPMSACRYTE